MSTRVYAIIMTASLTFSAVLPTQGAERGKMDIEIGRILFISQSASEVMVLSGADNPSLYVVRGSVLYSGKGEKAARLLVTDVCGSYIRCGTVKTEKKLFSGLKEGDTVFYSDSSNENVKYNDVRIVLGSMIKLYEDFIFRIESVEDPALISGYIDSFSSEIEKMIPEMDRLYRKYPELLDFYSSPPSELRYESETLKLLEPSLKNAFFKIKIYAENPQVKRSIEKLNGVFVRLRGAGK